MQVSQLMAEKRERQVVFKRRGLRQQEIAKSRMSFNRANLLATQQLESLLLQFLESQDKKRVNSLLLKVIGVLEKDELYQSDLESLEALLPFVEKGIVLSRQNGHSEVTYNVL